MDNVDLQILRQIRQWRADGHRVVLGTITRTWGSAPRPPGSSVAVRDDGKIAGSVSGGCIEDDLIDKAREGVLASGVPKVVRYGIDADTASRFGLPCGGLIELVLEPVDDRTRLGEQVLVCDPREAYADEFDVPGAKLLRTMPDDTVKELQPDGHTAIIALTHDPKLDDLALMEAVESPAFYVGALGSRANQAKRRARLKEHFGLTDAQFDRIHGPVGLKNGARTPPEIAVSILAELTAVRYGYRVPEPVAVKAQVAVEAGCVM